MNVGVILAGGVGNRMNMSIPKQFFKVAGKTVIEHTIDAFEFNKFIDEIVIVSNSSYINDVEALILKNPWKKVKKVLHGGKERYESSLSAIYAYEKEKPNLIFHDAVRPLVSQRILNDVVKALDTFSAVDVAIPAVDTIIETEGDFISNIPNRNKLKRGQTPQGFRYETINLAYKRAISDPDFKTTDDCGVVQKYLSEEKIRIVEGEEANMKITYKEDILLLDKLFQLKTMSSIHISTSLNELKGKVVIVFGDSSGIGKEIVEMCKKNKAFVYGFSRSSKNVDISNREQVKNSFKFVISKHEKIDYVVNTAGVLYKEPLNTMNNFKIDNIIDTNFKGTINIAIESFPFLKESNGQLLFFTSSSFTLGRAFYSLYSSTKAATVNFVQALAQEWQSENIRVNCIMPERTDTPMRTRNFGLEPKNTLLSANEVAKISLLTLLSDFTGQVIDVKKQ